MFTLENTEGYTKEEIDKLNAEFEKRWNAGEWYGNERDEAEKWFADEVTRR